MPVALSEQDAMRLLFEGETNRAIAEHQLNKSSSRQAHHQPASLAGGLHVHADYAAARVSAVGLTRSSRFISRPASHRGTRTPLLARSTWSTLPGQRG